jgi:hypothetical protein
MGKGKERKKGVIELKNITINRIPSSQPKTPEFMKWTHFPSSGPKTLKHVNTIILET